jgi:hypothetical protein
MNHNSRYSLPALALRKTGQRKQTLSNRGPVPTGQAGDEVFGSTYYLGAGRSIRHVCACWAEGDLGFVGQRRGRGRHTAQTCANVGQALALGYAWRWPPLALTSARIPARIASGRSAQAAVTLAQSGSAGTADGVLPGVSRVVGTTVGTARCWTLPKSLASSILAESWLRPPEPKVTSSNLVGDTSRRECHFTGRRKS